MKIGQGRYRAAVRLVTTFFVAGVGCLFVTVAVPEVALGQSAPAASNTTSSPPNPPTNLNVTGQTQTSLTLNWTPSSSSGVTGYDTFVNGVDYGNVSDPNAAAQTFTDLACSQPYTL